MSSWQANAKYLIYNYRIFLYPPTPLFHLVQIWNQYPPVIMLGRELKKQHVVEYGKRKRDHLALHQILIYQKGLLKVQQTSTHKKPHLKHIPYLRVSRQRCVCVCALWFWLSIEKNAQNVPQGIEICCLIQNRQVSSPEYIFSDWPGEGGGGSGVFNYWQVRLNDAQKQCKRTPSIQVAE